MIQSVRQKLATLDHQPLYQAILLGLVTLVAAALRLYMLGEWSFWGDEMITVKNAHQFSELSLMKRPLSMMLIYTSLSYLGTSEWSTRLVPALAGILTIPILYVPIRKMFGPAVALLAGLLLAVSPWHLYWSQNARFYSMMLLLYTLALVTFYFGIEEDRPWYLILSLFFLGLATWERLTALLLIPVLVAYLGLLAILPFEKPAGLRWRNVGLYFLPGLVPGLFLAWPYIREPERWLARFGWVNISPFWVLGGVVYYIGIPAICMGAMGVLYLLLKRDRASLLLGLGAAVPLVTIVVIAMFQYTANRYVFVSLTSWLILAAVAVRELLAQTEKNAKILAAGALVVLLAAPLGENVLYYQYQHGNRDNWKAAFAWVKQHKQAGDLLVVANPRLAEYYLHEKSLSMGSVNLERIGQSGQRVWFVEDLNVQWKSPRVLQWLRQNAREVANMDVHVRARNFKMRVYLYEPPQMPVSQVSPLLR